VTKCSSFRTILTPREWEPPPRTCDFSWTDLNLPDSWLATWYAKNKTPGLDGWPQATSSSALFVDYTTWPFRGHQLPLHNLQCVGS
jgi:hypothetical protein